MIPPAIQPHRFANFIFIILVAVIFLSACHAPAPKNLADIEQLVSVKVYVNHQGKFAGPGIYVEVPTKFSVSAKEPGVFYLRVSNLLDENIFVEDDGLDTVNATLESSDGTVLLGGGGSLTEGGSPWPYRLLHHGACEPDGRRFARDDGIASLRREAPTIKRGEAGLTGTLRLWLSGYFQGSNKRFFESFDVPITIVP